MTRSSVVTLDPMLKPLSSPPRCGIFLSGQGSNAERVLEQWQASSDPSYELVVLVTDRPHSSRAAELAKHYGLDLISHDLSTFARERGCPSTSLRSPEGRALRDEWTDALRTLLQPYALDFAVFAGFITLTNITGDLPCLNVHPGDLTYERAGSRYFVGLHTIPVERCILEGIGYMRSSVILAEPYHGRGDDMDSGPILGVSQKVTVDLAGHELAELKACQAARPSKRPRGGYQDILAKVANINLERLKVDGDWTVLPAVVADFAAGRFARSSDGKLHFDDGNTPKMVKTVLYNPGQRQLITGQREGDE